MTEVWFLIAVCMGTTGWFNSCHPNNVKGGGSPYATEAACFADAPNKVVWEGASAIGVMCVRGTVLTAPSK